MAGPTATRTPLRPPPTAPRNVGDRYGEGTALNNLGLTLRQVGRFDEAIAAHQHAADIFRETGDQHREGIALNKLGNAKRQAQGSRRRRFWRRRRT